MSRIQRNRGIGKKLLEEAERTAVKNGAHKIYLQIGKNWAARKFYEKRILSDRRFAKPPSLSPSRRDDEVFAI